MKQGLSRKLAWGNIKKNYRFFVPRILAETGLLACFYIIFTLACDSRLAEVKGGNYLPTFMLMGAVIIGLLSFILILYSNSFLMKQRKREFGLYSVLGMEKKHICRVLFHESFICSGIAVIVGLLGGILFYKVSSLSICLLLKTDIVVGFYFITPKTLLPAAGIFIGIDLLAYAINCIGIARMNTVELLASVNAGEREPKVKWLLFVLGILTLGAGYYISLTTESPLSAILLFFAAVILVILGTYFLFIAGSIFVLKALKRKESYYYKPRHFTAVSGLLYRMKQNAVGLASVAILATGVLVMISTTFCLYSGTEDILNKNFPQDFYISATFYDENVNTVPIPEDFLTEAVADCAEKNGLRVRDGFLQEYFYAAFSHRDGALITDRPTTADESDLSSLCIITFITEESYIELGGTPLGLRGNEVAVCTYNIDEVFDDSSFTLGGTEYTVVEALNTFPISTSLFSVSSYAMVLADDAVYETIFKVQTDAYGEFASERQLQYCVNFTNRAAMLEHGPAFQHDLSNAIEDYITSQGYDCFGLSGSNAYWETRHDLYGMYGTLLFLGILLGLVCLFATVLIIYYKQISEGYEDRERYQIMQKIGMTETEVRGTIRTQVMTVFFLPLVTAGIHVAFAFPILTKLMEVLLLDNVGIFAKWCLIVYLVFAVVYALIYRLTAKSYYKIVY